MGIWIRFVVQTVVATCLFCGITSVQGKQAEVDYTTQIAPILTKYCVSCHNQADHEGEFSVETFGDLQQGSQHGTAMTPGRSESSRLIQVLTGQVEPRMPPEDNEAPTAEEVKLLQLWIDAGGNGPEGEEPARQLLTPQLAPASGAKPITAAAMSLDGLLLAVGRFGEVEIRGVGGVVRTLGPLPGKVNAVHFSADGARVVVASGVAGLKGAATIWEASTGTLVREIAAHRDTLYDAELSPDETILATCSYDRRVMLWNAETGEVLRVLEGHNDAIYDIAFSPDGNVLATASGDETAKLWKVQTGQRLDTLHQPQAEQYVVAFSPDGRYVLSGGADKRLHVWRFLSKEKQIINPLVYSRFAHEGAVIGMAFTRDGRSLVSASEDRTVKVWETKTYTQVHLYETQSDEAAALAVSPIGDQFAVGRLDGTLEFYPTIHHDPISVGEASPTGIATVPIVGETGEVQETEPNDLPEQANTIQVPTKISGVIQTSCEGQTHDADVYRFSAMAGQPWMLEINAARQESPLDSKIEVLDADGKPVMRVLLRAVRDSYFTFRGKNSDTSDDYRVHNWEEMELNEYLHANGEVVKLWHYPRGPDSGFQVYPGNGNRFSYFDTTPIAHPLHEPCYIVQPHAPGTSLIPNGLPEFPIYFENDDESQRRLGTDSLLSFSAPKDGDYLVRVSDSRGFSGEAYKYDLHVRPRQPGFEVSIGIDNVAIPAGSGQELTVTAKRLDGFDDDIHIDIGNVPPGFHATTPIVIERGQNMARGSIYALPDAPSPTEENANLVVTATAMVAGDEVTKKVDGLGALELAEKPNVLVRVLSADTEAAEPTWDQPLELVIAPGETISARVKVERFDFDGRVGFGGGDACRNAPHGVFVDNIGLNGLLIVEGQDERIFFITASPIARPQARLFHLRCNEVGNQTSWPVRLHVQLPDGLAASAD